MSKSKIIIRIKITNKMQLCSIIYYSIFFPLAALHDSSNIIEHHQEHLNCNYSFWFHLHVLLSAAVLVQPRHQPTTTHVNETRSCNYS